MPLAIARNSQLTRCNGAIYPDTKLYNFIFFTYKIYEYKRTRSIVHTHPRRKQEGTSRTILNKAFFVVDDDK